MKIIQQMRILLNCQHKSLKIRRRTILKMSKTAHLFSFSISVLMSFYIAKEKLLKISKSDLEY